MWIVNSRAAGLDRGDCGGSVIDDQSGAGPEQVAPAVALEPPLAARRHTGEIDRLVVRQLRRQARPAARRQVAGRGAQHPPYGADANGRQRRVRQLGNPDGNIDALVDQMDDAIGEQSRDRQVRVAVEQVEQNRRHDHGAE